MLFCFHLRLRLQNTNIYRFSKDNRVTAAKGHSYQYQNISFTQKYAEAKQAAYNRVLTMLCLATHLL
jgi:hypothetical protein